MAERKKCIFCLRERAADADWDLNGQLDDAQIDAADSPYAYLNNLCWEEADQSCMAVAIELGHPITYEEAMGRLQALQQALEEKIGRARREAVDRAAQCEEEKAQGNWSGASRLDVWVRATTKRANRLTEILEQSRKESGDGN